MTKNMFCYFYFLYAFLFAIWSLKVNSLCESFQSICLSNLNQPLSNTDGENFVKLNSDHNFYAYFNMPIDVNTINIDVSVLYGALSIYVALNREPTASDFDYSNIQSSHADFLSITSLNHLRTDRFNVLIKASSEYSSTYFHGLFNYPLPSVASSNSAQPIQMSVNGMPQTMRMGIDSAAIFQFVIPTIMSSSVLTVDILATEYAGNLPTISLFCQKSSAISPTPVTHFNNYSNAAEGYISFTLAPEDIIANSKFLIKFVAVSSMSYYSLSLRLQGQALAPQSSSINNNENNIADPSIKRSGVSLMTHTVVLMDGQPQKDRVSNEENEHYYVFYVPPGIHSDITISLDHIQGDVDLYANPSSRGFYRSREASNSATWSSALPGTNQDVIRIRSNDGSRDPNYILNGGAYYITVVSSGNSREGVSPSPPSSSSSYMVHCTTSDAATVLVEGFSITDSVAVGSYKYYRFHDTDPLSTVLFDLLPTATGDSVSAGMGDVDLYVGCQLHATGNDNGMPSKMIGHYNFSSNLYLEDVLSISPSDPHSCSLGSRSDSSTHRGDGGVFYLTVYGYRSSSGSTSNYIPYTLSAQHASGEKTLIAGRPMTNNLVFKHQYQRFKIRVGFEVADLKIILSPVYGDCDLYVKLNSLPSTFDYDYQSSNYNAELDTVSISEQQLCADCWVHILVYSISTSGYSIVGTFSDNAITLSNGVPQRSSVASDRVQYYSYQAQVDCYIVVVVTVTTSSSSAGGGGSNPPSVYVSRSVMYPNATSPDTQRRTADSGIGTLPRLVLPGVLAHQLLHIGVGGDGHNVTYTVRVHETPVSLQLPPTLLTLEDGMPQEDAIGNGDSSNWLYYKIGAPIGHETITIRTVMEVGYVELYTMHCPYTSTYQCTLSGGRSYLPNSTYFDTSTAAGGSSGSSNEASLTIQRNDATNSLYIIGVRSLSYYAAYQLSSSLEGSTLRLQEGVPVTDHVNYEEVDYFSFYIDQPNVQIKIALSTLSGDPDLYVSTTVRKPSPFNHTWQSDNFGPDVIVIDPATDTDACSSRCTYYIAVIGSSESTYTISASTSASMSRLIDGVPSSGVVNVAQWTYYSFHNAYGENRDIRVMLTSTTGNADIYATLDGTKPTLLNYAYGSANWFATDAIEIAHTDQIYKDLCYITADINNGGGCVIIIGIYSFVGAEFKVTLTSTSAATILPLNTVQTGSVAMNGDKYYRVILSQQSSNTAYTLRLTLTPTSGHVMMYVSCSERHPNATTGLWSFNPIGDANYIDILSIAAADKGCASSGASYYAAVHGISSAHYSIFATVITDGSNNAATVPLLTPGIAIPARALADTHIDYYFIRPDNRNDYQNLRLLVTVLQGDVDVFISESWEKKPIWNPTTGVVESYTLSSATAGSGSEDITINHQWISHMCSKRTSCYFIVAAFGSHGSNRPPSHSSTVHTASISSYSILSSTLEATILLTNGVPLLSHSDADHYSYFKYSLTQPDLDVVIAVTPLSGDPDIFIGVGPIKHPTRDNYTWYKTNIGADTITLQSSDIASHCAVSPMTNGKHCDIFIGVYGFKNSTYTVLAAVDEGFQSPITLLDQSPQSGIVATGRYVYYSYSVNIQPWSGSPPLDIKFTLTSTDGGDADLYALFEPHGNKSEPGINNFDYRSTAYGGVTDQIEVSSSMPHYCPNGCVVYLAIYGFKGGSYSIQASSSGFTALSTGHAMGGHVNNQEFSYYIMHNSLQFASLTFSLTMISGDADIYITTHKAGTSMVLPSRTVYTWRSLFVGSDTINIAYDDVNYCSDCDYLVGIFGYDNSTYTILGTDVQESIIKLVPSRPQVASIPPSTSSSGGGLLYFSCVISSSVSDVTIALTVLGIGSNGAVMYAEVYNSSAYYSAGGGDSYTLPDPSDASTYSYTTRNTARNYIYIRGPHPAESIVVIAVQSITSSSSSSNNGGIRFNIVAVTSQHPVILPAGQPQNHYVENAMNAYFVFYPHADEDLRISVTARSGDPDLLVSTTSSTPQCKKVTSAYASDTVCSNYTWLSSNYMTDQIILSHDYPCVPVIRTTHIAANCDPLHSYEPITGAPIYIGVFGFSATQFTLLVVPVGQQAQLLAGQPQLSRTSAAYICAQRSAANGACLPPTSSATAPKQVQVSYFSFRVSAPRNIQPVHGYGSVNDNAITKLNTDAVVAAEGLQYAGSTLSLQSLYDVVITVVPDCSSSSSSSNCIPGCTCAPLIVYINSCPLSHCSQTDKKPSELSGQHAVSMTVSTTGGGSTIILGPPIAGGSSSNNKGYCDPVAAKEDCGYFIAVTAPASTSSSSSHSSSNTDADTAASFTITARTPGDTILIPCTARKYADGIKFLAEDTIAPLASSSSIDTHDDPLQHPSYHYYEICSQQNQPASSSSAPIAASTESLVVELEQCEGRTKLYACADNNLCADVLPSSTSWEYYADSSLFCHHFFDIPGKRDQCMYISTGKATLTLPQRAGNYFLRAEGAGKFHLKVQTTLRGGSSSPVVVFAGIQAHDAGKVSPINPNIIDGSGASDDTIGAITGNTATFQWRQSRVLMPGLQSPLVADYMTYTAYIFDSNAVDEAQKQATSSSYKPHYYYTTSCGLKYAADSLPSESVAIYDAPMRSTYQNKDFMMHTFEGLKVATMYKIVIVATCGTECLRQLSKVTSNPRVLISCSASMDDSCQPQSVVYISEEFTTLPTSDSDNSNGSNDDDGDGTFLQTTVSLSMVILMIIFLSIVTIGVYWVKHNGSNGHHNGVLLWLGIHSSWQSLTSTATASDASNSGSSDGNINGGAAELVNVDKFSKRRIGSSSNSNSNNSYTKQSSEEEYSYLPPQLVDASSAISAMDAAETGFGVATVTNSRQATAVTAATANSVSTNAVAIGEAIVGYTASIVTAASSLFSNSSNATPAHTHNTNGGQTIRISPTSNPYKNINYNNNSSSSTSPNKNQSSSLLSSQHKGKGLPWGNQQRLQQHNDKKAFINNNSNKFTIGEEDDEEEDEMELHL